MTTIQTAAQIAAETAALKQQTTELNRNCTALKARGSELAKTATAGAKNTAVTKLGTAEKAKATQALDRNARAIRSEAVEQTLADMRKTGALLGVDSEVGRMRVETEIGRFSGESDDDKVSLLAGASRLDKLRAQMKMSAYIQSLANPDAAANEEKRQKQEALDQALNDGTLSQDKYDKERRGLGLVKRDGDFMLDVNDKLLESARNGASKIQDILGTKMYDFVADKFDKLGLSFLNNVAKMVTSAASAKLMETLLGNSFMEGKGGVGDGSGKPDRSSQTSSAAAGGFPLAAASSPAERRCHSSPAPRATPSPTAWSRVPSPSPWASWAKPAPRPSCRCIAAPTVRSAFARPSRALAAIPTPSRAALPSTSTCRTATSVPPANPARAVGSSSASRSANTSRSWSIAACRNRIARVAWRQANNNRLAGA